MDSFDAFLSGVKPKRLEHSKRVSEEARRLAIAHHFSEADIERVTVAALLHDCARNEPPEALLDCASSIGLTLDDLDLRDPVVRLHGVMAAQRVENELGIQDPEILNAIANHTLGRPGMSPVEQVVFVADWIEPGRPTHPGLAEVRELAYHSLSQATRLVLDYTLRYLIERKNVIHPLAVATRNWFILKETKEFDH